MSTFLPSEGKKLDHKSFHVLLRIMEKRFRAIDYHLQMLKTMINKKICFDEDVILTLGEKF
jgi:hypothetical protein